MGEEEVTYYFTLNLSGLSMMSDGVDSYMGVVFSGTNLIQVNPPDSPEDLMSGLPYMATMSAVYCPDAGYGIFEMYVPGLSETGGGNELYLQSPSASGIGLELRDADGNTLSTVNFGSATASTAGLLSPNSQTLAGEKIFTGDPKFRSKVYFQGATSSPYLQFSSTNMALNKNYGYMYVSGFGSGSYPTLYLGSKYSDGSLTASHNINLVTGAFSGTAAKAKAFSANKSVTLEGDVTGTASSTGGWTVPTTLADTIAGDKTFSGNLTVGNTLKLYDADLSGSYQLPGTFKFSMKPINSSDGYTTAVIDVNSFNPGSVLQFNFNGNSDNAPIEGIGSTTISMGLFGDADRSEIHADYFSGTAATAASATKVGKNLAIKLNGGSTEGTNLFTFNGSAAKTINITPAAIGAAAASHGNHVPTTETANNAKFLRNDNTWAAVTPANIGAAAASHGTHVSFSTTAPANLAATASAGSANTVARSDHAHKMPTYSDVGAAAASHGTHVSYGTSASAIAATAAAGTATTVSRSDHVHSLSKAAVTTALGTGTGTSKYLREDGTWVKPPNTTYSAGTALTLTDTTFSVSSANVSTMINLLGEGTSPAQLDDYLIAQYAGGGTTTTSYYRRKVSNVVNATVVKAALGTGTGTSKYLREDGTWVTPPDTNTKVTSVGNHYAPSADTAAALSVDASSTTAATWGSTSLVTGVNIQRDAKGHVTGVTVDSIKMPANPDTNTHYTTKLVATTSSGTAHAATTNGNTYLRLFDNTTARQSIKIVGSGATTVTSDANGVITISSTDSNTNTKVTTAADTSSTKRYVTTCAGAETNTLKYHTGVYVNHSTGVLMGAAWNDYAEFRAAETKLESGRAVVEKGDDTLILATERMMPGAYIVSDTYGFAIGETEICNTPIAVTGRVLAYPHEPRKEFNPGDAVCTGPNGTVSKMTREEIVTYPERILGTVSCVPTYDTYGEGDVAVNGRIWVNVK